MYLQWTFITEVLKELSQPLPNIGRKTFDRFQDFLGHDDLEHATK
jgi:hypothetical protein